MRDSKWAMTCFSKILVPPADGECSKVKCLTDLGWSGHISRSVQPILKVFEHD